MLFYKVFLLSSFIYLGTAQSFEGDSCRLGALPGVCKNIRNCPLAIEGIRKGKPPQICSYIGTDSIVCCVGTAPPQITPSPPTKPKPTPQPSLQPLTPSPIRPTPPPGYVPPTNQYEDDFRTSDDNVCPPLDPSLTSNKTGQKAWDKCIDYQQLVYPCQRPTTLTGEAAMSRVDQCKHDALDLIIGGVDAKDGEFPHMAMLGFGTSLSNVQWLCGGTLLSEWFILTAGHCMSSREFGPVNFIRLGALEKSAPIDESRVYRVARTIKHPQYHPPKKYNDIALLKTDREITLSYQVVPACLDIGRGVNVEKAWATGWGATKYKGANADILQKVRLEKYPAEECKQKFPPGEERLLIQGFQEMTQICYGHRTESKDTCQGDSGGPLVVAQRDVYCMYTVIGVTSFGKGCGFKDSPGVYTRVEKFTDWIQEIVWS